MHLLCVLEGFDDNSFVLNLQRFFSPFRLSPECGCGYHMLAWHRQFKKWPNLTTFQRQCGSDIGQVAGQWSDFA